MGWIEARGPLVEEQISDERQGAVASPTPFFFFAFPRCSEAAFEVFAMQTRYRATRRVRSILLIFRETGVALHETRPFCVHC